MNPLSEWELKQARRLAKKDKSYEARYAFIAFIVLPIIGYLLVWLTSSIWGLTLPVLGLIMGLWALLTSQPLDTM